MFTLDGRRPFPVNHGPTTADNFLPVCLYVMYVYVCVWVVCRWTGCCRCTCVCVCACVRACGWFVGGRVVVDVHVCVCVRACVRACV